MSQYAVAVARALEGIPLLEPGTGVFVVPPRTQSTVAEDVAGQLREWLLSESAIHVAPLTIEVAEQAGLVVGAGVAEGANRPAVFRELNARRDWRARQQGMLVLVLSAEELDALSREAPDLASTFRFIVPIPFVAAPSDSFKSARESLAAWYEDRFSRLNLRGFIRAENEDVAWRIEDVYQEIEAVPVSYGAIEPSAAPADEGAPLTDTLQAMHDGPMVVLLGQPGAGKTFYLRWLALKASRAAAFLGIGEPLPLLFSLAGYGQSAADKSLLDYMCEQLLVEDLAAADWVERAISTRQAFFLLDGLDETGEASRQRVVEAVRKLREAAPGCLLVVTCRAAGYDEDFEDARHFSLTALREAAIQQFLIQWCVLYACDRLGATAQAKEEGRREGEALSSEVLGNDQVAALASNPLMLTVLAIVHRAGVRLPDHRVELYSQATRILVERWNRIRGLDLEKPAPPVKVADAVRLLGPVALELIRSGALNEIPEARLRELLSKTVKSAQIQGLSTTEDALALFRQELGLLVEQGPGVYGFLHLTLAEYFAAWELVRTSELETLAADGAKAYADRWREVLLLAAGELGVLRADDERLGGLVKLLLSSAASRRGRPSRTVPSLLSGLLADDPGLRPETAKTIVDALVPTWWFNREYGFWSEVHVLNEAIRVCRDRLMRGRWSSLLRESLTRDFGAGIPEKTYTSVGQWGKWTLSRFLGFLWMCGVDYGAAVEYISERTPDWIALPCDVRIEESCALVTVPRSLHTLARKPGSRIGLELNTSPRPFDAHYVPWPEDTVSSPNPERVTLRLPLTPQDAAGHVIVQVLLASSPPE